MNIGAATLVAYESPKKDFCYRFKLVVQSGATEVAAPFGGLL